MGVVVAQSKATAHVFRVFAALVALLVVMAIGVTVTRLRSDRAGGSPYGALSALTQSSTPPATMAVPPKLTQAAAAVPALAPPAPAPPVAKAAPPAPASPVASPSASAAVPVAAPVPMSPPSAVAPAPPPASLAIADPAAGDASRTAPRRIALDRVAAGSATPQPAPPARVEAARAATIPQTAAASPLVTSARPDATQQAALVPPKAAAEKPAQGGGSININTASLDELNSIPGAGRIGRTIMRHRPYRSVEDLVDNRVLKARDLARIRAAITTH